jgi:hypothetical protein
MRQKLAAVKKGSLLFFARSLMFLFMIAAVTGENSAAVGDEILTPLGVKACVPRPSLEPPPSVEGGRSGQGNVNAVPGQQPCPEGLVPQPVERWIPRGGIMNDASAAHKSVPLNATDTAPTVAYYYSGAYQWVITSGTSAFLTQHLPWLMPVDFHTLAEITVESTDQRQIVEVGWIVDRMNNGDEIPRLFVFHWINGAETCYNGCGWVQYSATRFPGMKLSYDGTASQYMIEYRQGNWWIGYQGEWIGYFPGSLWNGTFTSAGFIQWFGELCAGSGASAPLSSMGNYYAGTSSDSDAARISQIVFIDDSGSLQGPATLSFYNTDTSRYNTGAGSESNEFKYGGHGEAP